MPCWSSAHPLQIQSKKKPSQSYLVHSSGRVWMKVFKRMVVIAEPYLLCKFILGNKNTNKFYILEVSAGHFNSSPKLKRPLCRLHFAPQITYHLSDRLLIFRHNLPGEKRAESRVRMLSSFYCKQKTPTPSPPKKKILVPSSTFPLLPSPPLPVQIQSIGEGGTTGVLLGKNLRYPSKH